MELDGRRPVVRLAGSRDGRWDETDPGADRKVTRGDQRGGREAPAAGPILRRPVQHEYPDRRWANGDLLGAGRQAGEARRWLQRDGAVEGRIPEPVQHAGPEKRLSLRPLRPP